MFKVLSIPLRLRFPLRFRLLLLLLLPPLLAFAFLLAPQFPLTLCRLTVAVAFLLGLEVLIFAFVVLLCSHDLRRFFLFHDDFDLPGPKVLNQSLQFWSFNAQELNFFFLFPYADFHVELLAV